MYGGVDDLGDVADITDDVDHSLIAHHTGDVVHERSVLSAETELWTSFSGARNS